MGTYNEFISNIQYTPLKTKVVAISTKEFWEIVIEFWMNNYYNDSDF